MHPARAANEALRLRCLSLAGGGCVPVGQSQENDPLPRCALPSPDAGKIERRHQTLKNRILLENYYLPAI